MDEFQVLEDVLREFVRVASIGRVLVWPRPFVQILSILAAAGPLICSPALAAAEPGSLSVELNKLETQEKGCRAYVVVTNQGASAYKSIKLDLVLFQSDGIIGKRFAVDLAPLKAQKRAVKLFDIEGTACDKIGSLLINDVMECSSETGPVENCLGAMSLSTLTNVQLSK